MPPVGRQTALRLTRLRKDDLAHSNCQADITRVISQNAQWDVILLASKCSDSLTIAASIRSLCRNA